MHLYIQTGTTVHDERAGGLRAARLGTVEPVPDGLAFRVVRVRRIIRLPPLVAVQLEAVHQTSRESWELSVLSPKTVLAHVVRGATEASMKIAKRARSRGDRHHRPRRAGWWFAGGSIRDGGASPPTGSRFATCDFGVCGSVRGGAEEFHVFHGKRFVIGEGSAQAELLEFHGREEIGLQAAPGAVGAISKQRPIRAVR